MGGGEDQLQGGTDTEFLGLFKGSLFSRVFSLWVFVTSPSPILPTETENNLQLYYP
jgi:hypothetical protein